MYPDRDWLYSLSEGVWNWRSAIMTQGLTGSTGSGRVAQWVWFPEQLVHRLSLPWGSRLGGAYGYYSSCLRQSDQFGV